VELDAVVVAEHVAVEVGDLAAMLPDELRLLEKFSVIVVRHETDFHALLFVGGLEVAMPRDFAGVALGAVAEREHRPRQLVLAEREKKITLVLTQVAAALEQDAAVVAPLEPRELAGGDELRAQLFGAI